MKKIESYSDVIRGTVTYEIGGGRYITLDTRTVQEFGLAKVMESYGVEIPTERVPVMRYGRRVGTVPGDFDLSFARSRSPFYDVRPGDLTRQGDVWVAARNMGASDLDCLIGFRRDDSIEHEKRQEEIRDETLTALGVPLPR
jgi:predicted deacylase